MEEKLKKDETEAEEISRAFTVLKGRVADYSTRLKQALADAKEGMKKEIADLDAKILKIQAKLDGLGVTVSTINVDNKAALILSLEADWHVSRHGRCCFWCTGGSVGCYGRNWHSGSYCRRRCRGKFEIYTGSSSIN
jgi:hypothetical protein